MIDLVLGAVVGWIVTAFAFAHHADARLLDLEDENTRLRELLRNSGRALERYGESRHLAAAIRHVLGDEAGA
jgi:hypothetical protein